MRGVGGEGRGRGTALQHDVVIEIRPRAAEKGAARVRVVGAA
jgi:hypothetical protein